MDKATVTNPPVPEPGDKTSVKNGAVAESAQEIENRVRENLRAEYDRKSGDLSEKLTEAQDRIAELEANAEPSTKERSELDNLKTDEASLEAGLRELDTRADLAPYREAIKREGVKAKSEAVTDALLELAKMERAEVARKEGLTEDALTKELNPIMKDRWLNHNPVQRLRLALDERNRLKEMEAVREENKRLKAERDGFSEDGTGKPRERNLTELRDAHIGGDFQAGVDRAKALDDAQKQLDSQSRR